MGTSEPQDAGHLDSQATETTGLKKAERPREYGKKLKPRHGHMFPKHPICTGPWCLASGSGAQRTGVLVLTTLLSKNDGLSLSSSDFVFSSFSSASNTTSGFEIKGETLADEFTARCWLLECTAIDLIQSTCNHRAPAPTRLRTPRDVTSPC